MSAKRVATAVDKVVLVLAAVFLLATVWAAAEKATTLPVFLLILGMEFAAGLGGLRGVCRAQDHKSLGEAQILASWWVVSVGLAGLMLLPSSFFQVKATALALGVCGLWVVAGCYSLITVRRLTGVKLTP